MKRHRTPTVLQMEAAECGAAALAMILGYHGLTVPLERLRIECGVSRDGTKASNVVKVARKYGLDARGYTKDVAGVQAMTLPCVVFWNFNHFLVVEGFDRDVVFINDPASGPLTITAREFDQSFTGVALSFVPGAEFKRGGTRPSVVSAIMTRLRGSMSAAALIFAITLAIVVPALLVPTLVRLFVDSVLIHHMGGWLWPLALGMIAAALLQGVLVLLQNVYLARLQVKLALATSSRFLWRLLHLPIPFFGQRHPGQLTPRVAANDRVADALVGEVMLKCMRAIVAVILLVVMATYDPLLTAVVGAVALLNLLVLRGVSRRRVDGNRRLLKDRERVMATAISGLEMIETTKATGAESEFFARWAGYHARLMGAEQELGVYSLALHAAPALLAGLSEAAVLGIGGVRVMMGAMTVGTLVAFQSLMRSFLAPVRELVQVAAVIQEVSGDITRLDDVMAFNDDDAAKAKTPRASISGVAPRLVGEVELRDVTFGYNPNEPPLLAGLSLVLHAGARVAVVGASGSGKSTVARLVAGLCEPTSGQVLLDGRDRRELPGDVLANSVALVEQDVVLFRGTIRDNLTLWDTTLPDARLADAARSARINDVIDSRPGGFDSEVTDGGTNFSGGQRQRLEIARALAARPSILVLDEATSALDALTEELVAEELKRARCTCLIVAHRLSTIRDCDRIIVLEHGRIVQQGTHDSMIGIDGPYARLVREEHASAEREMAIA